MERGLPQPGHILILKPPVIIVNLLPIELNFKLDQYDQGTGRISPGQTAPLMQVIKLFYLYVNTFTNLF